MSGFVPGIHLSRDYYAEVVRPTLSGVPHSAALIGPGSEVLECDTERSTDHDWGPRVVVFTAPGHTAAVHERVTAGLPAVFRGYPTVFGSDRNPPRHGVQVAAASDWLRGRLGFDPLAGIGLLDWLATPWQRLAEVTAGEVFHDGLGVLEPARQALRWYPPDVWRYLLACQWTRIAQREAFPGRAAEAGDEVGAAVLAAGLAEDLMRLVLLMRRRYPPYGKWLGTAFTRVAGTAEIGQSLAGAMAATDRHTREEQLCRAYVRVADLHNRLALTPRLDSSVRWFHDRPLKVIGGDRFAAALRGSITDPVIAALPPVGSVDQFGASTDLLSRPALTRAATLAVLDLPMAA